jgi:hypothetical protein
MKMGWRGLDGLRYLIPITSHSLLGKYVVLTGALV